MWLEPSVWPCTVPAVAAPAGAICRPPQALPRGGGGGVGWRGLLAAVAALVDLARRLLLPSARHEDARTVDPKTAGAAAGPRPLTAAEASRFRETMLSHLDAAYTLARYLSRDADAAEDIVQDAYLRAYRSFADFRGASARAWLLAIVRNCHHSWRDQVRRDRQRRAPESVDADGEGVDPVDLLVDAETPETILLRRTEADAVRALLELLPELLREVLVLRELDDLSYREIAMVTGVPVGTVMSRLSRARRQFADLWERACPAGEGAP